MVNLQKQRNLWPEVASFGPVAQKALSITTNRYTFKFSENGYSGLSSSSDSLDIDAAEVTSATTAADIRYQNAMIAGMLNLDYHISATYPVIEALGAEGDHLLIETAEADFTPILGSVLGILGRDDYSKPLSSVTHAQLAVEVYTKSDTDSLEPIRCAIPATIEMRIERISLITTWTVKIDVAILIEEIMKRVEAHPTAIEAQLGTISMKGTCQCYLDINKYFLRWNA